jgi:hypothetical protein
MNIESNLTEPDGTQPKKSVRDWYYNPLEDWWYHRHKKGIWPFRKEILVAVGSSGICPKCGKQNPNK